MKIGTLIGVITVLLIVVFILLTPINVYPDASSFFAEETGIELPTESILLVDEKEIFGDAFRRVLFTSSKDLTEQVRNKISSSGFQTRDPQDVGTMFFMPKTMKTKVQKEDLLEYYRTEGPQTVVVVLSSGYIFIWEAWI